MGFYHSSSLRECPRVQFVMFYLPQGYSREHCVCVFVLWTLRSCVINHKDIKSTQTVAFVCMIWIDWPPTRHSSSGWYSTRAKHLKKGFLPRWKLLECDGVSVFSCIRGAAIILCKSFFCNFIALWLLIFVASILELLNMPFVAAWSTLRWETAQWTELWVCCSRCCCSALLNHL